MQDQHQQVAALQAAACLNCDAALAGRWCSSCGQSEEAHHRSLGHFLAELAEVLTHADSRLWRTLGRLAWRPGRLTRDYLEGHRISQLPPLRLVMIALFLLFTVASLLARPMHVPRIPVGDVAAEMQHELSESVGDLKEARSDIERSAHARDVDRWVRARVSNAVADPKALIRFIADWAERFAILMLPASAVMLAPLVPVSLPGGQAGGSAQWRGRCDGHAVSLLFAEGDVASLRYASATAGRCPTTTATARSPGFDRIPFCDQRDRGCRHAELQQSDDVPITAKKRDSAKQEQDFKREHQAEFPARLASEQSAVRHIGGEPF